MIAATLAVGYLPTLLGIFLAPALARLESTERAAVDGLIFGALLFLFADFLSLTANLGVGAADLAWRGALLLAFAGGMAAFAGLERWGGASPSRLAVWWALGVGLHSLAEGIVVGNNLTLGLDQAFRPLPLLSFVLHKLVEGVSVAALLARGRLTMLPLPVLLASVAALPLTAGGLLGAARLGSEASSIFYALGAGSVAFILPAFAASRSRQPAAWTAAGAAGFLFIAVAALLHEL
ncbi:MAG TPA: hypothetical protein VF282_08640 [Bacillota bacterium]